MKSARTLAMGLMVLLAPALSLVAQAAESQINAPMVSKKCMNCHQELKDVKNVVAGDFYSRSGKAGSIQVQVDEDMRILKYRPETRVVNVPEIKSLKAPIPVRVHYKAEGEDLVATEIVAKPEIKVEESQLLSTEELKKLVAEDSGDFTLADSRPGIKYQESHIPGAISIPFPKMAEMKGKLPEDKDQLLAFYCGGFR